MTICWVGEFVRVGEVVVSFKGLLDVLISAEHADFNRENQIELYLLSLNKKIPGKFVTRHVIYVSRCECASEYRKFATVVQQRLNSSNCCDTLL